MDISNQPLPPVKRRPARDARDDEAIASHYLGGEMIHQAHIDGFEPRPFPRGLEAGTLNIEGVIGLGAAVDYLDAVGVPAIEEHSAALATSLRDRLRQSEGVELVVESPAAASTGIVTFRMAGLQSQGLTRILSQRFNIMNCAAGDAAYAYNSVTYAA